MTNAAGLINSSASRTVDMAYENVETELPLAAGSVSPSHQILSPGGFRESLYREFQPLVSRLIRQYGDCPEMRSDLQGEIFCRFCSLLDAFEPERGVPLRPYMVRQLSASVYVLARRGWSRRRREVSLDMNILACDRLHAYDPSREWDCRLLSEQIARMLPKLMSRLSERQRQVVIWRYYEDRSFEEIARILNIRLATARSLLRHGLNRLRRSVANFD